MTRAWCVWAWKCEIYYPLDIASSLNKHAFSQKLYSWPVFLKFKFWDYSLGHRGSFLSLHWALRELTLFSTQQPKLCEGNLILVPLGRAPRAPSAGIPGVCLVSEQSRGWTRAAMIPAGSCSPGFIYPMLNPPKLKQVVQSLPCQGNGGTFPIGDAGFPLSSRLDRKCGRDDQWQISLMPSQS